MRRAGGHSRAFCLLVVFQILILLLARGSHSVSGIGDYKIDVRVRAEYGTLY